MPDIDRGEGHPANRSTDLPRPGLPPRPEGLDELAGTVAERRRALGGRLILHCHPAALAAVMAWSPEPGAIPSPRLPAETPGLSYRQVECHTDSGMGRGAWRLIDGGEVVAGGTVNA